MILNMKTRKKMRKIMRRINLKTKGKKMLGLFLFSEELRQTKLVLMFKSETKL
jgi:hypothetical protein